MSDPTSRIMIVGGGPAGLSAALSASEARGVDVTLVDDNPRLGGQIWRAELGKIRSPDAQRLIDAVESGRVGIVNNAQVFAPVGEKCLIAEAPSGRVEFEYEKLVVATGARERFLPFPGWTLPNVVGTAGLQALVKGGVKVENKRVVVAGTGPLLLVVAEYLRSKGANVVAIAEQAPVAAITRFVFGLWRSPAKIVQAASLRAELISVPYLTDCWATSAEGKDKIETVTLTRKGKTWTLGCDFLACGFHLVPNTELAAVLGCEIKNGSVAVDDFQQTSRESVFCAGEQTGIGGVEASLVEGRIAGYAATGDHEKARRHFTTRQKVRDFTDSLNRAFSLRDELKTLADETTLVCRCEDVEYGRLLEFENFRDAKLQTRCGMGACQGRICGSATEFLFGWKPGSVRPPIFPVKMESL